MKFHDLFVNGLNRRVASRGALAKFKMIASGLSAMLKKSAKFLTIVLYL